MQHSKRRKWRERILSVFLSFAMILNTGAPLSPLFAKAADAEIFTEKGGYENGAYAEWKAVSGAAGYKAYIQKGSTKTLLDDQLIRQYPDNIWRVDALGLAAGDDYKLVVEAYASGSAESPLATYSTDTISVITHDRNGFAFTDPSGQYPGAYDKNGVLRSDAKVIYVDNTNFDTVPLTIKKDAKGTELTLTGVQNIVNSSGFWKYAEYNDFKALDIRVIGLVNTSGFPKSSWGSSSEGLQIKGNGKLDTPITIEGVGDDATVYGFGIFARSSSHVEISNLGIMCFADDGVSLDTDNSYTWVHNCDIFYGSTGGDADQAKGDGTIDVKGDSKYQTYSYNHFWDSGKASLCGMKSETGENFITYHHNWFDHSDSRHPRVRTMSVHAYNNFYDGIAKYGAGAAYRSSIFMEKNYFRDAKYPMLSSMQGGDIFDGASPKDSGTFSSEDGGIIKAYENAFEGNVSIIPYGANNYIYKGAERAYDLSGASSTEHFDAYFVSDRTMEVPEYVKAYQGGSTYTNFDTIEDLGVDEGSIQDAVDVPSYVMAHAGRVGGGDLWWEFDDAADDVSYEVNSALKAKVVAYKTALKTIGGFSGTVIPASIRDESYVRVTGDRTAASERYKAGETHTLHEVEVSTDVEVKTYTPVDGYSFNAATYLTAVDADTTADSYTIEDPDVAVYANFGLVSPRTVSGKTDRIALAKSTAIGSCGSFTIKNVTAAKKVIRFVLTADGAAKTAYYKVVKGDTVLTTGSVTGTAAQTVEVDIDGKGDGDYSLIYAADNLANSGSIRIISAEVDTVEVISGGAEPDNTDYALKVVKGANVTTDLADTTHKKKDAVTFTASVTDTEKYKLSVSIRKGTGENSGAAVSYSYTGNDYRFTMPASDVTVTLAAVEKTAEVVEPDTEFFDVTFEYDGNTKRVSVEEGKSVASSDVPDMSAYANFVCWSTDGTEAGYVVPEELKITADVTIIAVIKESLYEVDDDFVAATFLSDIGAFTLPFGALQENSAKKCLANAWLASEHEGYDPLVYKRFTLHNWKIPSKNTDTVGIVSGNTAETCGYVEIDAPAAASLTIVARAAGSGKTSYFTLTGPDGRDYEPTAGSNKVSGSGETTLTYKLGVAGVYTIALDIDKQKADTKSGELRFYEIHLKGVVDEEADPNHEVRFLQYGDPITEFTVAHGGFIPANAIPSPSLTANQEFLGWSSTTDEADIVDTDKILASNVLSDQTWTAIIEETGTDAAELYTVTYHIGSTEYTESVKAGEMLSDIPAVTAPAGKKFNGWSETEGGAVLTAAALAALTVSADKDLYAVFENVAAGAVAHVYDYTGVNYPAKGVKLDLSTGITTSENFFTVAGNPKNEKYTPVTCAIDNKTYGSADEKQSSLKLESNNGSITFTTAADDLELTVIELSTKTTNIKLDGNSITKTDGIYKAIIDKGTHTISKGSGEGWVLAVYVVEPDNTSKPEYTLTVNTTGVETSLQSGRYYEGTTLKFSAKPMDGSVNMVVKKGDTTLEPGEDGLYSITMNADASVNMIAEKDVAEYHNVNVTAWGVNTSLTAGR
nr:InlB B-repeat-containing protein [Lachnospiraceae bacterium]